ncbi:uncharacterized protein L969DRAFT_22234 [Mixia osmundae IAM 14324]|uniref:NAD(P)-binding domain-containing protein n=1 Tax=Mixia osmundae (strain CBS 9802 / IAM 14324 / JCM 22182 / KY 12970) TaxID=764103 RepID=G7DYM6_MIXOS|nr:uncharacterized protein L969DRAFT_22234 [Mixia osmundae IAM 14324]KEI41585.1 hypothetical protein L969DRAFT_22234 [Mixia osmundae IAM 14324]GAA95686.1 hypothetical protein E5Q_02343 [Mixia osmundae IAM 14324]
MRFLILGGTGAVGQVLLAQALEKKHECIVFARSPQKLPEEMSKNSLLTVIKGELHDAEAVKSCFFTDKACTEKRHIDAILSVLGPQGPRHPWGCPISKGYQLFIDVSNDAGQKPRLIILSTISVYNENDKPSLLRAAAVLVIWGPGHMAWREIIKTMEVSRNAIKQGKADITLVRIPFLSTYGGSGYSAGYVGGSGAAGVSLWLSREDMAGFMLDEGETKLSESQWNNKEPAICSK